MTYQDKNGNKVKLLYYGKLKKDPIDIMVVYQCNKSNKIWIISKKEFLKDFSLVKDKGFFNGGGI